MFELRKSIRLCSRDVVDRRAAVTGANVIVPPALTHLIIKDGYHDDIKVPMRKAGAIAPVALQQQQLGLLRHHQTKKASYRT